MRLAAAVMIALCAAGTFGCSSESGTTAESGSAAPSSETASAGPATTPAPSGAVGLSPGGVTTAVDAPAESLEEEYFQACQAARVWMEGQGGATPAMIEPYLASIQSTDSATPGTFGTPWSQLPPARQAAVIVAVEAAAAQRCG